MRLNASLASQLPVPGRLGRFTQSGAIGASLLSGLPRRGAGGRALAEAADYARWRHTAAGPGRIPEFDAVREAAAADDVRRLLADAPTADEPLVLAEAAAVGLLARYGIVVRPAPPAPY